MTRMILSMGLVAGLLFVCTATGIAQPGLYTVPPDIPPGSSPYYSSAPFSLASPGAWKYGLYGYDNPALLGVLDQPDLLVRWQDVKERSGVHQPTPWGLFLGVPHLGFGVVNQGFSYGRIRDYRISLGFGDEAFSGGLSYGWTTMHLNDPFIGVRETFARNKFLRVGTLVRPNRYMSLGLLGAVAVGGGNLVEGAADLAVRPLGTSVLTVYGDVALRNETDIATGRKADWSAGGILEALPGIRVFGRYLSTKVFTVGIEVSLGRLGASGMSALHDGSHLSTLYGVRLGAYDRNMLSKLSANNGTYVEMNMRGPLKYQRYRLFDRANTLADILDAIRTARADRTVGGIAINTSGMEAGWEMMWEIRDELKAFRAAGKKVVIFVDRPSLVQYHFASVADRIIMDPAGLMIFTGFVNGRTFLKGTLDKIGVGFDEWRFFRYKSADEPLSRERMSEADREQRQRFIDEFYALAKKEICEGRGLSEDAYESIINDDIGFLAPEALAKGLVDTLARWDAVEPVIRTLEGSDRPLVGAHAPEHYHLPSDDCWGRKPAIAIVYAQGVCAMDEGISARSLARDIERAGKDPTVRAIVLRVESPGGDAMASDYVADALLRIRGKKPVIISQGGVAASGGYWLSMYGDTIVAAPNTLTGSIGVIGGWFYNKGLKETLGFSTDKVQAGAHADLMFGFTMPLIGIGLPDRNLTSAERRRMEKGIRGMYDVFVSKVAEGRRTSVDAIAAVAQGRIWTGSDGKEKNLVDVLGGMGTALDIARTRAGIREGESIDIVEFPEPGLVNLGSFFPRPFGVSLDERPPFKELLFRMKNNGLPLPMVPMDTGTDLLQE